MAEILTPETIELKVSLGSQEEAIRRAGALLVENGNVEQRCSTEDEGSGRTEDPTVPRQGFRGRPICRRQRVAGHPDEQQREHANPRGWFIEESVLANALKDDQEEAAEQGVEDEATDRGAPAHLRPDHVREHRRQAPEILAGRRVIDAIVEFLNGVTAETARTARSVQSR